MDCVYQPIELWPSYIGMGHTIVVASTPCQVIQGLQFQKHFPEQTLLLFPNISPGSFFHTNNCVIPIDIIALNSLNIVLKVWTVLPGLDKIGPMPRGTDKVLEARAGWTHRRNIKPGTMLPI